ncbi:MAG: ABC transporter ATP-binding protein [Desulfobulbaceae bacterium]|nr:ABC transporter ATP-binding protein [Desulfobulbaceae bacterium]
MIKLPTIFAGTRRWLFIRLIINGFTQAAMIICSMLLVRYAFNVLFDPEFGDAEVHLFDLDDVWLIGLFAVGLLGSTGLAAWLRFIERVDAERLGQEYIYRVRLTVFDRMTFFAPRALSSRSTGNSMLRFVGDLSAIRRWVCLGLARIVVSAIVAVISIAVLGYLDLYLAICSTVILSLGLAWNLKLGPRMRSVISDTRRVRGRLAGNINEKIRSFAVIQAFNQQKKERSRFSKQSRQLREITISRSRASAWMRVINEGAAALSMAAILSVGSLEVFRNHTSTGNVAAALAVVSFLSNAFRDFGRVYEYLQAYQVSRQKIFEFMQTKQLRGRSPTRPSLQVKEGVIELQGIYLRGVLRNISATIPSGARLAIVGDNGAGKSTLLQVIARMVDPNKGKILIDGQDIGQCNLASVRNAIGIVSPDLPLLRGSVRKNLRYRKPDASPEEVERVKQLCQIDDLLNKLSRGEDFRIQEGGGNLSLGQRHKLTLARALLGRPAILILDEIDANLDEQSALMLEEVIRGFSGTVLMVSRSSDRLALADIYWRLAKGKLVAVESNEKPPLKAAIPTGEPVQLIN